MTTTAGSWKFDISGCERISTDGVVARAQCDVDYEGVPRNEYKRYDPMEVVAKDPPPPTTYMKPNAVGGEKVFTPAAVNYANMCADMYYADGKIECIPLGSYLQVCSNVSVDQNRQLKATCYDGEPRPNQVSYNLNQWQGEYLVFMNGALTPYKYTQEYKVPGALYYFDYLTNTPNYIYTINVRAVQGKTDKPRPATNIWINMKENAALLGQLQVGKRYRFLNWSYETGVGKSPSPYITITGITTPRPGNLSESQIEFSPQILLVPNQQYSLDTSYIFSCKTEKLDRRDVPIVTSTFTYYTAANPEANRQFKTGRRFRVLKWSAEKGEGKNMSTVVTITKVMDFIDDPSQTNVIFSPPLMMKPQHLTFFQLFD